MFIHLTMILIVQPITSIRWLFQIAPLFRQSPSYRGRRKNIPFSLLLFEQHISSLRSLDTDTGCNQLRSVPYKQRPVSRIFVTDYGIVRFHFHSLIGCGLRRIRQRENMVSTPVFTFHTDTGKVFQAGLFRIKVETD